MINLILTYLTNLFILIALRRTHNYWLTELHCWSKRKWKHGRRLKKPKSVPVT